MEQAKKVRIDSDERYPFFFLARASGTEVELTAGEVAWVDSTFAEFEKMQTFLESKAEEAGKA